MATTPELQRLVTNLEALLNDRPRTALVSGGSGKVIGHTISEEELRRVQWIGDSLEIARKVLEERQDRRRRRETTEEWLARLRRDLVDRIDGYAEAIRTNS